MNYISVFSQDRESMLCNATGVWCVCVWSSALFNSNNSVICFQLNFFLKDQLIILSAEVFKITSDNLNWMQKK